MTVKGQIYAHFWLKQTDCYITCSTGPHKLAQHCSQKGMSLKCMYYRLYNIQELRRIESRGTRAKTKPMSHDV